MRASIFLACFTAPAAISFDCCACRLISLTEQVNSSAADATACTLTEACSEAVATSVADR